MEYGLIGEKLGHSTSPEIHNKLADYSYELCPLSTDEFTTFMEKKDFKGINVTIPYKQKVIPYLDEMDASAKAVGAVNVIVNRDGKLYGSNTDMPGFIYMVKKNRIDMTGKKVVLLGNGGAAQAVKAAIRGLGASELILVNRHTSETETVFTYDECYEQHTDADIIVNTTPLGMFPNIENSPLDVSRFPKCTAVIDIIANPLVTKLVAQARELGMVGITGLEMLVAQAKYASEIFQGIEIPEEKIEEICEAMK